LLNRLQDGVHRLIVNLRPAVLDDLGLAAAIDMLAETQLRHAGITVRCELAELERHRLAPAIEITVFRIVQEAITNIMRHSGATSVLIQGGLDGGHVWVEIEDDGHGFDLAGVAAGRRPARDARARRTAGRPTDDRQRGRRGHAHQGGNMSAIRVLIVDDHALVRDGIRALLVRGGDMTVVGEAGGGREAIALARALRPDVILMDIAMPDLGGLEATLEIRKDCPDAKIIVLSQYGDREYVHRFLRAGVSGYVLKKAAGADLVAAIHAVARGGLVLDPEVARDAVTGEVARPAELASEADPYDRLTDREKQVLKLVAEGRSNKEVASLLGISVKTAMSHREHVMDKLDVHSRTDLIRFALKCGVIRQDG
jgi:DNA-binding NarL/FixJ family response regulator